ncbi:hypothetical protein MTT09_01215 [Campylobacter concisus]|uniref:hypothetical protein n=1 Tax=Campylobacter concisus TaxID=199 RepID=UPI003D1E5DB3
MRLDNTKIIRSIEELLFEFGVNGETYKNITFYCRDLNHFYNTNILNGDALYNKIFTKLYDQKKAGKNVSIKTYKYFDKFSLFKNDRGFERTDEIKVANSSINLEVLSQEKDIIEEFTKELANLANSFRDKDDKVKNFEEASSELVSNYKKLDQQINSLLDKLQNALIEKVTIILNHENFDKGKESIEAIKSGFTEIKENLEKASKDGKLYIAKEIFKFLFSLIDITDLRSTFKPLTLLLAVPDALSAIKNVSEFLQKRGFYAFSGPVMSLLATKFGFTLGLLNTVSFNNILVFTNDDQKSGAFIDFSGFDITATRTKSNYDEYIGICSDFSLEGDEKSLFDAKISKYENIDKKNNISICKNDKDNTEESLLKRIEECVIANRANFVYMQYPFFNSLKFANLLRDKSLTTKDNTHNTNNSSGISKNYLVISNAPIRENAKLNEHLLQNVLNYKIVDSLNRADDKKVTDPKQLNGTKDYSQYSIQIDAKNDEDLYLLSLSPFTRVSKEKIEKFKNNISKNSIFNTSMGKEIFGNTDRFFEFAQAADYLSHIDKHFKNAKDMEEIIKNEKEFLKANIEEFKTFFLNLNSNTERDRIVYALGKPTSIPIDDRGMMQLLSEESNGAIKIETEYYYPATKVFLLTMGYFILRQIFDNSIIKPESYLGDEAINLYGETLLVLSKNTYYLKEDKTKVPIYFFKKEKKEKKEKEEKARQKDAICIEEIVETIEKSHVADDDHILNDDTYSELKKILEQPTTIDTYDMSDEKFASKFKKENSLSDEEYKELKKTLSNPNNIDTSSIEDEKFKRYIKQINDDEYKDMIDFSLKSIMNDILYDIFPFYGFFIDKCGETVWKSVIRTMFYVGKDAAPLNVVKGIFMATGGELRLVTLIKEKPYLIFIGENDKKNINLHKGREFFKMQKLKSNDYLFSYFGQKAEDKAQRLNQEKLAQEYKGTTRKLITLRIGIEFAKNAGKTVISNLTKAGFNFFLDSAYTSSYEQQKRSYELILHKYFTNKFNDTYAVKNISYEPNSNKTSEYTYYPIEIYSSFINIDLKRTIIGGRLSSGGLDYHNFFYYDINTTTNKLDSNLSKDISLDTMISYLCLDELRTNNKTDEEFFNNLNKRNKKLAYSPKELMLQGVKTLLTISPSNPIGIKQRGEIYDLYSQGVEEGTDLPIDKYNEAMEILEDFKNGNLNTFGSEVDNKSRRLLKALDVIGNNNVKGMYVGCRFPKNKSRGKKDMPPRLIGRLATTIVMEDGLYIG